MRDDELVRFGGEVGRSIRDQFLIPKPAKELPPHVRQAMWKAALSILLQNAVPDTRTDADERMFRWSA